MKSSQIDAIQEPSIAYLRNFLGEENSFIFLIEERTKAIAIKSIHGIDMYGEINGNTIVITFDYISSNCFEYRLICEISNSIFRPKKFL